MSVPNSGVCQPWVTLTEESCTVCCSKCDDDEETTIDWSAVDFVEAAMVASELLFIFSGRQYPGECARTVIPAERFDCHPSEGYQFGGLRGWYRFLSPGDYPITSIESVKINGVEQDLSDYQVLSWTHIVRRNTAPLPSGDDLFEFTYKFGMMPPASGVLAAEGLGCQLALVCAGGCSSLPEGTISIAKQGLSATLADPSRLLTDGQLGLAVVDRFLAAVNPGRLLSPSVVITPDTMNPAFLSTWTNP